MSEIIIALDFPDSASSLNMVSQIGEAGNYYKVGLELFTSEGHIIVPKLKELGKKVFLDLKFHDIPNTAAQALKSSLAYDVDMVNIHVQGGTEMMKACAAVVEKSQSKPLLIGVTMLTSLDEQHMQEFMINCSIQDYVVHIAKLAKDSGIKGVVASPAETRLLKDALGEDFITVTPGIRLADDAKGDQKRIMTPVQAAKLGTDYMVIGRSITTSKNPQKTTHEITESIRGI